MSAHAGPQGPAARGRLRIYLGYAPGAGTTCALLSEGRRRAEHGTDVVVASAETHGRPHTEYLLAGLEAIPSAKVPHRGTLAEEMDVGAVLARGPAVALVEDFAHRNAPGSRHRTRWQDVEDLLAAGIDVTSTAGVGHLDSLADVMAKITDTAPRQTVPDPVVRAAGEVELVDLAPEALQDRLARGHIYPADQAEAAPGGWFQTGNLSALRELALLWLAATLAGGPRRHRPGGGDTGSRQARERVVAALSGGPEGETLIRRAARIAARSGGDPADGARRPAWPPAGSGRAVPAAQRRLAESLGGTYHQLADQDIPAALLAFAHAHNATQLVLGATPRTRLAALRPAASIRSRVIRRGGGLDVHIVTCTPTANGVPAATCEHNQREHSDETAEHLLAWPRAASGTMGAPGGRPSVNGGIPGGVRGQADRCCPAGLRRLWRYDEDAMTNIRTPIGSLGAGWQRSRPAWLCTLPTPGKRHRGVPAVVTGSPCCSQSSASVSCTPTPGQGVVGNGESCCSHEEVRQWETRTSPTPTSI